MVASLAHKLWRHFQDDSLFRNSFFLMMATAVMSGFGFVFWLIWTKFFTPADIGVSSSLMSMVGIVSSLSVLGFNNSLIRYLPTASTPGRIFRSAVTLTVSLSFVVALVALMVLRFANPSLSFVTKSPLIAVAFVIFSIFGTLSIVLENTFIALRSSEKVFIKNSIFSIIKLVLPIFFIGFAAFGLFAAISLSTVCACIYGFASLRRQAGYLSYRPLIDRAAMRPMLAFSLSNYVVSVFSGFPSLVLPIIITNRLGAASAGYYYIDFLIATLLFVIPSATSNSFLAEGSQASSNLRMHALSALKISYALMLPAIVVTYFLSPYLLAFFGKSYAGGGTELLRLLAVSGIFIVYNGLAGSYLNLKQLVGKLMVVSILGVACVLVATYVLASYGLVGIGCGWLIGQILISVLYTIAMAPSLLRDLRTPQTNAAA